MKTKVLALDSNRPDKQGDIMSEDAIVEYSDKISLVKSLSLIEKLQVRLEKEMDTSCMNNKNGVCVDCALQYIKNALKEKVNED